MKVLLNVWYYHWNQNLSYAQGQDVLFKHHYDLTWLMNGPAPANMNNDIQLEISAQDRLLSDSN